MNEYHLFAAGPLKPKKLTRRQQELARVHNATVGSLASLDGAQLVELAEFLGKRSWRWTAAAFVFALLAAFPGPQQVVVLLAWSYCLARDLSMYGEARAYRRIAASIDAVADDIKLLAAKRNERL